MVELDVTHVDLVRRGKGRSVVGGRRTHEARVSRLLVLCAVLFGLFLMHGAPASAAGGCHGDLTMTPSMNAGPAHAPMAADHTGSHPRMGVEPDAGRAHMGRDHTASSSVAPYAAPLALPMGSEQCVSTPARDRLPLAAAGLFALLGFVCVVAGACHRRRGELPGTARRGPPFGGRGLLLQVCVART
ncbi:hypothetical protein [Streptomyces sp. NPDC048111]|uniref:hypothetical protein n=1 Tax=Streptomyces sp. NPDC048111 TaxID=3365500 RepID=UPI003711CAF3